MLPLKLIGLLIVGLLFSANLHARVLLLASQQSDLYEEFINGFSEVYIPTKETPLDIHYSGTEINMTDYKVIIVAGVDAAKDISGKDVGEATVLYTMMPLSSYLWLEENNELTGNGHHRVLYIDQPAYRYVNLAKEAFPGIATLGFLYGDVSSVHVDELTEASSKAKVDFEGFHVLPSMKLPKDLKRIFAKSDALMVMPDPYLYNRHSVQGVLLASFRYKKPMIAYSESFVKAGALLGVFSTPAQIGIDTAKFVICIKEQCPKSKIKRHHPHEFTVVVNSVVARQLGLKLKSAEELQAILEEVEKHTH